MNGLLAIHSHADDCFIEPGNNIARTNGELERGPVQVGSKIVPLSSRSRVVNINRVARFLPLQELTGNIPQSHR
jgi:hypothetical protein